VNQLLDRWFNDVMRHQVASPALSNYQTIAKIHIRPTLGRKQVSKLKPAEIDALLLAKLDSGLSVSTVRRIRSVLAQALTQAQRWEMVGRNAASLNRPPRAPRREGRSLSPEQVGKLVNAMTEDRLASLFLTMLGTGLRRGEALGLRWSDVDLDHAVLTVRNQLRREPGRLDPEVGKRSGAALVLVEPKTSSSKRIVPLCDWVVEALKMHKVRQAAERQALGAARRGAARRGGRVASSSRPRSARQLTHEMPVAPFQSSPRRLVSVRGTSTNCATHPPALRLPKVCQSK
jgi:integrase